MKKTEIPHILAIASRTAESAAYLVENWNIVAPATFPPENQWYFDKKNGVALYGNILCANDSYLAMISEGDVPPELSGPQVAQTIRQFGAQTLTRLPGSFALVYWDVKSQTLLAARDAFGQQEIFYLETPSYFFFSSDIAQLLNFSNHNVELNYEAAVHYLLFGLPPVGQSFARNIKKLPAGQYYESIKGGLLARKRFYSPLNVDAKRILSEADKLHLSDHFDTVIQNAVGRGKQALLLSGGIDSSYLAYTMQQHVNENLMDAYSIEFEWPYTENETHYARAVAEDTGINFNSVLMTAMDATEALKKVLQASQPASAWASLTHVHLSQAMMHDGHKTFLSGLGADEVFGGYSRFLNFYRKYRFYEDDFAKQHKGVDAFENLLMTPRLLQKLLFPGVPVFFSLRNFRKASCEPFKKWNPYIGLVNFYQECRELKPDAQLFEMMVAHECQHRIPDLLFTSFDSIGRTLGMSGNYPFLDKNIVDIACGLGASERFWIQNNRWKNKKLLKEIAIQRIPSAIINRPIGSYTTPIFLWLKNKAFSEQFRPLLMEGTIWNTGLISKEWREEVDRKIFRSKEELNEKSIRTTMEQAWIMVTLAAWYEHWVKG
jgi:asparagine synthase (glutamine-hydrolysing)